MRLRIVRTPTESRIDGIRLDRFHVGTQYEVGTALGGVCPDVAAAVGRVAVPLPAVGEAAVPVP